MDVASSIWVEGGVGMYFNVSQLMQERSGSSRSYEVDEELERGEDGEAPEVSGSVALLRTDQGIWASAALDSEVPCVCSRCLEDYRQSVHIGIEEEFFSLTDSAAGRAAYGQVESYRIDQDHILDLAEAVRQYLALGLPMKPVCRDGCKGICVACGTNLNQSVCQCENVERDSRWGALLDLVPSIASKEAHRE
jgi:uncharacterized protein